MHTYEFNGGTVFDRISAEFGVNVERSEKHGAMIRGCHVVAMFPDLVQQLDQIDHKASNGDLDLQFDSLNDDDAGCGVWEVSQGRNYGPKVSSMKNTDIRKVARMAILANLVTTWQVS